MSGTGPESEVRPLLGDRGLHEAVGPGPRTVAAFVRALALQVDHLEVIRAIEPQSEVMRAIMLDCSPSLQSMFGLPAPRSSACPGLRVAKASTRGG